MGFVLFTFFRLFFVLNNKTISIAYAYFRSPKSCNMNNIFVAIDSLFWYFLWKNDLLFNDQYSWQNHENTQNCSICLLFWVCDESKSVHNMNIKVRRWNRLITSVDVELLSLLEHQCSEFRFSDMPLNLDQIAIDCMKK